MPKTQDQLPESRLGKAESIELAAFELFQQRGYGNVSMDEIAKIAGVSKATIYSHFPDKAELFASLMRTKCAMSWVRTELDERPAGPDDVRPCLLDLGQSYIEVLCEKGTGTRIVIAEGRRFPELAEIFYEHGPKASRDALKRYLDRACAAGVLSIPDTDRAANQFYALLRDDTYLRVLLDLPIKDAKAELHATVVSAVDMFLRAHAPQH
jgi:AcrR family transcriptional regulator